MRRRGKFHECVGRTVNENPMFTEAVDNFVDNYGLPQRRRRTVLLPNELPAG
jgi:hypothetical protein